jgi:3'-5' exoribonuclease
LPLLPRISSLDANAAGTGFFLCARKEKREGRNGAAYLAIVLQDISGEIGAKLFQDIDEFDPQFEAGEFVAVQGHGNLHQQRLELVLEKIRRVIPDDASRGFREEDCIAASPRPLDEMWAELQQRIASVDDPHVRELLTRLATKHADRLRVWPAAVQVHHAYRGGLLEHVLQIMDVAAFLADRYHARRDLLVAGALLHDLGKLDELSYSLTTEYTVAGNLVGHIAIGLGMLRDEARAIDGFPPTLLLELEHLVLSHHGERDRGSPVEPMTLEAFILSAVDNLDATLNQVRRLVAADPGDGPFTAYSRRLDRKIFKTPAS